MILTDTQIKQNLAVYKACDYPKFISNYEIVFAEYCENYTEIPSTPFLTTDEDILNNIEYPVTNYADLEINFIKDLNAYRVKRLDIMMRYFDHLEKTKKYPKKLFYSQVHKEITNAKLKYHFLSKKLYLLDSSIKLQHSLDHLESKEDLDLSNTKGTEKIIYLQQLGILDHLKEKEPFRNSTNSLAMVISAITGIPQKTAQSYLNPISNPEVDQKNNPLNSIKKVDTIQQTLIKLGFTPQK
ncbi:hypothetical protein GUB10_11960 [Salegentibacter sp. BLCTC]|uniref:hypothetical protein n=1 Tax=Salegentibacter sp. BLCTC TaxID=2697368 RepID=UPI00187B177C|nr:hypothetical protein [Salegentibacter sp. BLCTC]MBE7641050.1 hypothetical protein [Salegentibacter sp. BLCTC]